MSPPSSSATTCSSLARPTILPGYLNYKNHVKEDSLYNTPPTFAIYLMKLVLEWLEGRHRRPRQDARDQPAKGQAALRRRSTAPAASTAAMPSPTVRSLMNVTFRLPSEDLEKKFVKEGEDRGLDGLKGHRSVGGIRACIYNAMPLAGVEALATFMHEFKQKRG